VVDVHAVTMATLEPNPQPRAGLAATVLVGGAMLCLTVGSISASLTNNVAWGFLAMVGLGLLLTTSVPRRALFGLTAWAVVSTAGVLLRQVLGGETLSRQDAAAWLGYFGTMLVLVFFVLLAARRLARYQTRAHQAITEAEQARVIDPGTDLANRRGLEMLAGQIFESARRRGDAVYCIFLDIDGLDQVNSRVGRSVGDGVIRIVAQAVTSSIRGTDATARWGDDEFVVIGPGTGLPPLEMERRIRTYCLDHSTLARTVWPARVSAGGAVLEPWNEGSVNTLLREAEREMRLRRTLRRESTSPTYRPVRHDPSPKPPEPRR
jgi:diguanylate cyclase (GGDEF)-like protein